MIIYINGFRAHVEDESKIAQTKQVNNMFDLSTRQTNYTNAISLPMTGVNIKIMEFLGISGNNSTIPYRVNTVSVFSDNGECFIYNGRCIVIETGKEYKLQFLDGNIDLYKAMGNDKLGGLDLSNIKHIRKLETVRNSFQNDLNYKYIVADYNGKSILEDGSLNIDYLVPSIKISFLWEQLFKTYRFTYSGSFFNSNDFKRLWLTYPSGAQIDQSKTVTVFESSDWYFKPVKRINNAYAYSHFLSFSSYTINDLEDTQNNIRFKVSKTGSYRIKISGGLFVFYRSNGHEFSISVGRNYEGYISMNTNAQNYSDWAVVGNNLKDGEKFEKEVIVTAEAGDILYLIMRVKSGAYNVYATDDGFKASIEYMDNDVIDFSTAFQDFGIKEFFTEITNRFALVPIKDKYTNHYNFYTLDELMNRGRSYDWSDKKPSFINEKYLYNSYQQRNYFRLKYDSRDVEYNDGFIQINNQNLEDKVTVYQSQLYSPEYKQSVLLGRSANVYKLWNKEIKDDSTVTYKTIDKRFFFISYETDNRSLILGSKFEPERINVNSYPMETFRGLDFASSVSTYYKNSSVMLNNAVVKNIELMLNDVDISEIDFSRQVYLKQFSSYFLINKINNYISALKPTTVELIQLGDFIQDAVVQNVIFQVNTYRLVGNWVHINVTYNKDFFTQNIVDLEILGIQMYTSQPNSGDITVQMHITRVQRDMMLQITGGDLKSEVHVFTLKI